VPERRALFRRATLKSIRDGNEPRRLVTLLSDFASLDAGTIALSSRSCFREAPATLAIFDGKPILWLPILSRREAFGLDMSATWTAPQRVVTGALGGY
jgi:hypothetical protein